MTLALGAHTSIGAASADSTTTSAITTSSGSCLLAFVHSGQSLSGVSLSDSKGNTWTQVLNFSSAVGSYGAIYKQESGIRGASHTVSITLTNGYSSIWVQEVTGASPVVSGVNTPASSSSSNPLTSNSYTNTAADELILAFFPTDSDGGSGWTFTNSFVENGDGITNGSLYYPGALGSRIVSSVSAYTTAAGLTSPGYWGGSVLTLVGVKETGAAAATLNQSAYRFINDDGSEAAATFAEAVNTPVSLAPGATVRVRFQVDATSDPPSKQFALKYRRQPSGGAFGEWADVN